MENETKQHVAYYRVSTKKQGRSGLGLAAQKDSVHQYLKNNVPIDEFTDIESGKKDDREELLKAIDLCIETGATLVIAKLDRLSRNVAFIASLMDSKVKFVAVDMPDANEFTVHIFAALAQQERKFASKRTKEGLAAAVARGQILGKNENLTREGAAKGNEVVSQNAFDNPNNKRAYDMIKLLREDKNMTYQAIATYLNDGNNFKSAQGMKFHASQVRRIYLRYKEAA